MRECGECDSPHYAKGFCRAHYMKARRPPRKHRTYLPFEPLAEFACPRGFKPCAMAQMVGTNHANVYKYARRGKIELFIADRWAVSLGTHPVEIWGADLWIGALNEYEYEFDSHASILGLGSQATA